MCQLPISHSTMAQLLPPLRSLQHHATKCPPPRKDSMPSCQSKSSSVTVGPATHPSLIPCSRSLTCRLKLNWSEYWSLQPLKHISLSLSLSLVFAWCCCRPMALCVTIRQSYRLKSIMCCQDCKCSGKTQCKLSYGAAWFWLFNYTN